MKVVNNTKATNIIKVKDAMTGRPYYWQSGRTQLLVMAFTPCHDQERGCRADTRHFIRLDESDVSGIILHLEEELIPAGKLTCTVDPY